MSAAPGDQQIKADEKRRWTFKSVVLGDSGVGKTWLVDTALSDRADSDRDTGGKEEATRSDASGTVGVTFNLAKLELEGGSTVLLQVWDTSGKERYRSLLANYMSDLNCAIIVFDPCRQSAETCCASLAGWHQLVRENFNCASASSAGSILFCVVAISGCDSLGDGDSAGCRGCCCDHLRCLSAGRAFAEALKGRFFRCRRVRVIGRDRPACQWLDEQQLDATWLGRELLRRQLLRLPAGLEAKPDTQPEGASLRRQQARSCCERLSTQLHALLRIPAMAALLLISRRPPNQE